MDDSGDSSPERAPTNKRSYLAMLGSPDERYEYSLVKPWVVIVDEHCQRGYALVDTQRNEDLEGFSVQCLVNELGRKLPMMVHWTKSRVFLVNAAERRFPLFAHVIIIDAMKELREMTNDPDGDIQVHLFQDFEGFMRKGGVFAENDAYSEWSGGPRFMEPVPGSTSSRYMESVPGPSGSSRDMEGVPGPSGSSQDMEGVAGPSGLPRNRVIVPGPGGSSRIIANPPIANWSSDDDDDDDDDDLQEQPSSARTPTKYEDPDEDFKKGYEEFVHKLSTVLSTPQKERLISICSRIVSRSSVN